MSPVIDPKADLTELVANSRHYGADPEFVIAGGGNTSLKTAEVLYVKGSGTSLGTITPEGFVAMDRAQLQAILETPVPADAEVREERFKAAVLAARLYPERGQRPSVESVIHHLMPARLVVHTHATWINMFTCAVGAKPPPARSSATTCFGSPTSTRGTASPSPWPRPLPTTSSARGGVSAR